MFFSTNFKDIVTYAIKFINKTLVCSIDCYVSSYHIYFFNVNYRNINMLKSFILKEYYVMIKDIVTYDVKIALQIAFKRLRVE